MGAEKRGKVQDYREVSARTISCIAVLNAFRSLFSQQWEIIEVFFRGPGLWRKGFKWCERTQESFCTSLWERAWRFGLSWLQRRL